MPRRSLAVARRSLAVARRSLATPNGDGTVTDDVLTNTSDSVRCVR